VTVTAIRFSTFAERDPQALALVDAQERCHSRGALAAHANRLSRGLRRSRLAPGDILALAAPNGFEFLATYLAAMQCGLYVVPINWHLAPEEIQYILEDCKASALVTHERLKALMSRVLERLESPPRLRLAWGAVPGCTPIDDFIEGESTAPVEDPVVGRVLSYTSATTGRPKGVRLNLDDAARALDLAILTRTKAGIATEAHVQLVVSMLYHGLPLEASYIALQMGNVLVLADATAPETILQFVERYRVTLASVVPNVFSRLLGLSESARSRYSLTSLQRVVHGGAPCGIEVKRRMIEWLGPIILEMYGSTEGVGTIVSSHDWLKYPGTVGKPVPGSRVKILGDAGEELPAGQIGAIYMTRYSGDRFEYLGDPQKTQASHRGDFFTVGDVGYLNDEGFLFLSDRKIDMIIRSGMKVYSAEVERVLGLHPAVADCAVFGVPDEVAGEAVMAVIQPRSSSANARELRADIHWFLSAHLSPEKIPSHVVFTEQLPREATGKLKKRQLREIYWRPAEPRAQRETQE
jgi:long-chain acyl-CoA synthetase